MEELVFLLLFVDPEDGAPKYCKVRGHVIKFNAETINDFLNTLVVLVDREEHLAYS